MDSFKCVWEQEMYNDFIYSDEEIFFHVLETDEGIVGISFADQEEASSFYGRVLAAKTLPILSKKERFRNKLRRKSKKQHNKETAKTKHRMRGFMEKINFFKKWEKPPEKKPAREEFTLSKPQNFRKVAHIGWDAENGFEVNNIPDDWKAMFKDAGITKKEAQDPETAKFIMNVVSDYITPIAGSQRIQREGEEPPRRPLSTYRQGGGAGPVPPPPGAPPSLVPPPPMPNPPESAQKTEARGGGMLADIQKGNFQLHKVDPNNPKEGLPDVKSLDPSKATGLASTLAAAMNARRQDIEESESESSDSEWSD